MYLTRNRKMAGVFVFLLIAVFALQILPVRAAETAKIYMKADEYSADAGTLKVSCVIENGDNITNGKLRFYYDSDKLTLTGTEAGDALGNAMTEINDCLTGNKEEGEIVTAFASSDNISADGTMFTMQFDLKDGVKEGDEINFEIKNEKLAGDSGDVTAEVQTSVYTVGEDMTGTPGGSGDGSGEDGDKNGGSSDTSDKNGSTGSDKTDTEGSKTIKTGDNSAVIWYGVAVVAALAVICGVLVYMVASRKRHR